MTISTSRAPPVAAASSSAPSSPSRVDDDPLRNLTPARAARARAAATVVVVVVAVVADGPHAIVIDVDVDARAMDVSALCAARRNDMSRASSRRSLWLFDSR